MKIVQVNYNCEICGTPCKTTNHNLRYRKHFKNKHYCQNCMIPDRLLSDGILDKIGGFNMWKQIRRICDGRTVEFTEEKHKRIAKIGHSRYFKKPKNQKDIKIAISR